MRLRATRRGNTGVLPALKGVASDIIAGRALLDCDLTNNVYWFEGQFYSTQAAFLTATGGSITGGLLKFGAYVDPAASELIVNGTFDTDTTGWTGGSTAGAAATLSVASAALVITALASTNPQAVQTLTDVRFLVGHAYRLHVEYKRGTLVNNMFGVTNKNNSGFTSPAGTGNTTTFTISEGCLNFQTGMTVMLRVGTSAGTGTAIFDNISLKEATPFVGYVPESFAATIWGTTGGTLPSTTQVIAEANESDIHDENCIRVTWIATTGHIVVTVLYGTASQASLDLGAVAISTPFKIDLTTRLNEFAAWLNDGTPVIDTLGSQPGVAFIRTGNSSAGSEAFSGTVTRIAVFGGPRHVPGLIRTEGDSYMAGVSGVVLTTLLATATSRTTVNTAVGGATISDISGRIALPANTGVRKQTTVIWDGIPTEATDAPSYVATYQQAIQNLGYDRYVIVMPSVPFGATAPTQALAEAIGTLLNTTFPGHVIDWRPTIPNTSGVINQDQMVNYPTDTQHLASSPMTAMAGVIASFISAKGW